MRSGPFTRILPGLALALALGLVQPVASMSPQELPPGAVVVAPDRLPEIGRAAAIRAQRWASIHAAEGGQVLVAALDGELDSAPVAEYELALAVLLQALASDPAADRSLPVFTYLAGRPVRAWRPHEESAGQWLMPLADPGGMASDALALRTQTLQRRDWGRRLDADPVAAVRAAASEGGEAPARLAEAVSLAPVPVVDALIALELGGGAAQLPAQVLHVLATRAPGEGIYRAALAVVEQARALELIASIPVQLPAETARRILDELTAQEGLASSAVLAMADLAVADPEAQARLEAWLADDALGPSAAAALARMPAADRVQRIERAAARTDNAKALAHAALALRLEASPAAREALQRLAADPRLPGAARRELRR
ncbi:MAG TPA: hypothetical protein VFG21_06935 [Xanthomonadaceae bacterium]|nr:hypothetical protein [Xanthomonadaceae bacterium]